MRPEEQMTNIETKNGLVHRTKISPGWGDLDAYLTLACTDLTPDQDVATEARVTCLECLALGVEDVDP